jgi:transposase
MDKACVKFYVKTRISLGENASKVYDDLQETYGENCPSRATIYRYAAIDTDEEVCEAKVGRPPTSTTPENIEWISTLIEQNRRLSTRDLEEMTGISREVVRGILVNHLKRRYVCAVWIPHELTAQQKELRRTVAMSIRKNLCQWQARERLYAVQDETWVYFDPVLTKAENKAWVSSDEKRPRVVRQCLTPRKTMLSVIFTCNKKFCMAVTSAGQTVDADYFINFLHETGEKWRKLRSDPTRLKDVLLQFDNARPHAARKTKEFLEKREVRTLFQAPYSPDLNMCDRWLFSAMKKQLRKQTFNDEQEVKNSALQVLLAIPQTTFSHELQKLLDHCQLVIDNNGDYVIDG